MIRSLLFVSLAPVIIIAIYVIIRDKYEKEPIGRLLLALVAGLLIVPPVIAVERSLMLFSGSFNGMVTHLYHAFAVASLTEEGFKYLAFMLLIWRSRDFNEKFDGIVYAVFISLGFAAVENLLYVYRGGYQVGMLRAFTAVPAHAIFGVSMGYHFGMAKFYSEERRKQLFLAFIYPFLWHGAYDFFLMAGKPIYLILFIPLLFLLWRSGFKRMKRLSDISVYRIAGLGDTETAGVVSGYSKVADDTNISDQA
jgi:RsiW-degrading membrane proteinase PrsW (M82 family)